MDTAHTPLNQAFAVAGQQSLVVSRLHVVRIVRMFGLHLPELTHVKRLVQVVKDGLDQYEPVKVFWGIFLASK